MDRTTLLQMHDFLEKTAAENEATEFDSSQETVLNQLIALVRENGNTSIVEDFETPFVHPMITVQKWIDELKLIVGQHLHDNMTSGFEK